MCNPMLAALLGLAAGCGAPSAPPGLPGLLAPADPRLAATFHPPAAPTAGVKRYAPVEARKDWGGAPVAPTAPAGASPAGGMSGTGGMDMPGMPGMPGMGGR